MIVNFNVPENHPLILRDQSFFCLKTEFITQFKTKNIIFLSSRKFPIFIATIPIINLMTASKNFISKNREIFLFGAFVLLYLFLIDPLLMHADHSSSVLFSGNLILNKLMLLVFAVAGIYILSRVIPMLSQQLAKIWPKNLTTFQKNMILSVMQSLIYGFFVFFVLNGLFNHLVSNKELTLFGADATWQLTIFIAVLIYRTWKDYQEYHAERMQSVWQ